MYGPSLAPNWIDWLAVGLLVVVAPLLSAFVNIPKLRALSPEQQHKMRPGLYVQTMLTLWLFGVAALWPVFDGRIDARSMGLIPASDWRGAAGAGGVLVLVLAMLWQRAQVMKMEDGRAVLQQALTKIEFIIPRDALQRRLWVGLSAHAGVFEELFYRAFLVLLLTGFVGQWAAMALSIVAFALAHLYQGVRGVVLTGLIGAAMTGLCLLSGSIWPAVVAHALYDIHAGNLGYWALTPQADTGTKQSDV